MVFAEFDRRSRRVTAHRVKLFVQMLTTTGYAAVGGALADPLFKRGPFDVSNLLTIGIGVAALALAIYYVPDGEFDAS